ncbi:MAG TPA: hypothetical protein ENI69_09025 [Rhodospirillales bacterium]|nr:hypothetical protein [Rhodospirillales bacterium]
MSFLGEVLNSLYGAYRLARMDPHGLSFFNNTEEGFWNSFKAAAVILPLFLVLTAVRYTVDDIDSSLLRYFFIEMIAYVVGWVAFPVLIPRICAQLQRTHHYMRFIIAYNWSAVLQNALYIPIVLFSITGLLPGGGGFFVLMAMIAIIVYSWFITKTALDIPGPVAAAIVVFDLFISFTINMYAEALI